MVLTTVRSTITVMIVALFFIMCVFIFHFLIYYLIYYLFLIYQNDVTWIPTKEVELPSSLEDGPAKKKQKISGTEPGKTRM